MVVVPDGAISPRKLNPELAQAKRFGVLPIVRVLVTEDGAEYVAQCLEYHLTGRGPQPEDALDALDAAFFDSFVEGISFESASHAPAGVPAVLSLDAAPQAVWDSFYDPDAVELEELMPFGGAFVETEFRAEVRACAVPASNGGGGNRRVTHWGASQLSRVSSS